MGEQFADNMKWEIYPVGSEEFLPIRNMVDLCFTSPPYFDLEKYADEPTQSYIKFDTKEAWIEGFLRPTFKNCHHGLKTDGYMLINIADVKGKHNINLQQETVNVALDEGFLLVDEYQLALSNVNLRDKGTKFKYEPIYVFKKWKS
jgi:DNA modification methylase